jgi:hypothetical protein
MNLQIRLFVFAVCISALIPIGMPAAQAKAQVKAQVKECIAAPSSKGHWSWRRIDGRKCWYAGKAQISKSLLRWPAAAPAQAKAAVPPVSIVTEKRSEPMDAQARMLDDDNSFESRWRSRVTIE